MKTAASKAGVRKGKINNIAKLSSGKTTYKTKGQAKRAGRALAKLK
jgi:flagellar biosynthesis/type III secretory pathway chaperone